MALVLLGGLWWWHRPAHPAPVNASLYETDMIAGLVRQILTEFKPPVPTVCFLAFGDGRTPPSPEFIARFAGSQPEVRSCGSAASPPIGKYFDVSTGRPGLVVHIIDFREIIHDTFDVDVSFSNLTPGHDRCVYRINRIGGDWRFKSRQL